MKKWVKILLIVLIFILIAAAAFSFWQWKNIQSIFVGINETSEEITKRRNENQEELVSDINSYIDSEIREMTDEEKEKIESGEIKAEDVFLQIFEEMQKTTNNKKEENAKDSSGKTVEKPTKDEIVLKYMTKLYALQSNYTAKAEVTIAEGKSYYLNLRRNKKEDPATARANTIKHFTPIVRGVEKACNAEVEELVAGLTKELSAIGENTDIVGTIRAAYEKEKQLKLSYYANKYLK